MVEKKAWIGPPPPSWMVRIKRLIGCQDYLPLTMASYQREAVRTAKPLEDFDDKVYRGILGLVGEAGELADYWKKVKFQGHELDRAAMYNEMGDILWYLSVLAEDLGISLEEVALDNIGKLRERFPDGFNSEQSIHRGL